MCKLNISTFVYICLLFGELVYLFVYCLFSVNKKDKSGGEVVIVITTIVIITINIIIVIIWRWRRNNTHSR